MFFVGTSGGPGRGLLAALLLTGVILLGVFLTFGVSRLLSGTLLRGVPSSFTLELPPYRLPTLKNIALHVWEKVKGFLVKAGTLILAMSVLLWFLQSFGFEGGTFGMVSSEESSILGFVGGLLAPLFAPLGFGTWQAAVALLTGLVAKEMVVSSMSMFYGFSVTASGAAIAAALGGTFQSPLAAYSFLVFVLLYVPCVAAVSTIHKEMNSTKWTLASIGWQLGAAWLGSFLVYQLGSLVLRVIGC